MAVKTETIKDSKVISKYSNCVITYNTEEITITLPNMMLYDDGHVIDIKNAGSAKITIETGYGYNIKNEYKRNFMDVDRGDRVVSYVLASHGDASRFIYVRDLYNGDYSGCWEQFKNPRDW